MASKSLNDKDNSTSMQQTSSRQPSRQSSRQSSRRSSLAKQLISQQTDRDALVEVQVDADFTPWNFTINQDTPFPPEVSSELSISQASSRVSSRADWDFHKENTSGIASLGTHTGHPHDDPGPRQSSLQSEIFFPAPQHDREQIMELFSQTIKEEMSGFSRRVNDRLDRFEVRIDDKMNNMVARVSSLSCQITKNHTEMLQKLKVLESSVKVDGWSAAVSGRIHSGNSTVSTAPSEDRISRPFSGSTDTSSLYTDHNNQFTSGNSTHTASGTQGKSQNELFELKGSIPPTSDSTEIIPNVATQATKEDHHKCISVDKTVAANADVQVPCTCQSQLLPLILPSGEINFVLQTYKTPKATSGRRKLYEGHIESYNVITGQKKEKRDITKNKEIACATMLSYIDTVTILGSDSSDVDAKTLKVELHQLKEMNNCFLGWNPILCSAHRFSSSQLNLTNATCVLYNESVVVVSVLKTLTIPASSEMILHLFTLRNTSGGHWRSASVKLCQFDGNEYKIQSSIIVDDHVYCSILLNGFGAYIYKVNLNPLKQCTTEVCKSILLQSNWPIKDKSLQNCFLAVGPAKTIFSIAFYKENAKTVIKLEKLMFPPTSYLVLRREFPSIITPVTASIVANSVAAIYHDNKTNQCYIKKINITDS